PLRERPRLRATSGASWRPAGAVTLSLVGSFSGSRPDSSIPTGRVTLPGFFVAAATATYVQANVRTSRAVDNLLDRHYDELIGFPAQARRVRVQVELTY